MEKVENLSKEIGVGEAMFIIRNDGSIEYHGIPDETDSRIITEENIQNRNPEAIQRFARNSVIAMLNILLSDTSKVQEAIIYHLKGDIHNV